MKTKLHPLVQKTKIELLKLDKQKRTSWEEQVKYNSAFLPISVEPKLRTRALRFMNDLINLLEANNHSIKFEYNQCHVEMFGQMTEINLRQKYFRKRTKDSSGYSANTFEKSNKLEFQVGSYARKFWIDKETKSLEDDLPAIYKYIDNDCKEWAELRKRQTEEKKIRAIEVAEEIEQQKLKALEKEKYDNLIINSENWHKAKILREYLSAFKQNSERNNILNKQKEEWLKWAFDVANSIDPLNT